MGLLQGWNELMHAWHVMKIQEALYNSQDIQTTQTSIDRRTFRRRYSTLIHWNTAQSLKDNKITPLAGAWIDLEISLLSEISQKEKDKCHTMSVIYEI